MPDLRSPRTRARIAGGVYLLFFLTAVVGALIPPGLLGPGSLPSDAGGVAAKITGGESGYELEVAFGLISTVFYVALIALLYGMLRPVGRAAAILMLAFGLVGCAVTAVQGLFQLGPLVLLSKDSLLGAFTAPQLDALALVSLQMSAEGGAVALLFFGVFQLFLGFLIYRSGFLPRVIGVLIAVAGLGWLTYVYPPLATFLATPTAVLGIVAEASLMLWLLIFGVNPERWREREAGG